MSYENESNRGQLSKKLVYLDASCEKWIRLAGSQSWRPCKVHPSTCLQIKPYSLIQEKKCHQRTTALLSSDWEMGFILLLDWAVLHWVPWQQAALSLVGPNESQWSPNDGHQAAVEGSGCLLPLDQKETSCLTLGHPSSFLGSCWK